MGGTLKGRCNPIGLYCSCLYKYRGLFRDSYANQFYTYISLAVQFLMEGLTHRSLEHNMLLTKNLHS